MSPLVAKVPQMPNADEPTVCVMDACSIAGVSRRTIYNWLDAGKIRYRRTAGGQVRIFRASLFVDGDTNKRKRYSRIEALPPMPDPEG